MTSKNLFLSSLVKDNSLIKCKYGKIGKNRLYKIAESKEYIHGEKVARVTVLTESQDGEFICDNESTKTFFGEGTFKNQENASSYLRELKNN